MPEERNRIVADHLADLLLAPDARRRWPTSSARASPTRAELVGDVMVDASRWAAARAGRTCRRSPLSTTGYVLLTLHRAENVDDPARLGAILRGPRRSGSRSSSRSIRGRVRAIDRAAGRRCRQRDRRSSRSATWRWSRSSVRAAAIATDSGGVQKEAYLAGVPCITLRAETEWVETVEAGWNRVVGADPTAARARRSPTTAFMDRDRPRPALYGDGHAAERIVAALERHHDREPPPTRRASEEAIP